MRTRSTVAVVVAMILVAAGCSSDGDDAANAPPPTETVPEEAASTETTDDEPLPTNIDADEPPPTDNTMSPAVYFAALGAWSDELLARMEAIDRSEPSSDDPQQHAALLQRRIDAVSTLTVELAAIEPASEAAEAHRELLAGIEGVIDLDERVVTSLQDAASASEVFGGPLSGELEDAGGRVLVACSELLFVANRLDIRVQLFCGDSAETAGESPDRESESAGTLEVDASGAAATGGTPLPDVAGAVMGDDGAGPMPLGTVNESPTSAYLNFLFELCFDEGQCFRDAVFMDSNNPELESGPWQEREPFHVRHGFLNDGEEPLGEGFDLVLYVFPKEDDGPAAGPTTRYSSDYVLRGTTDQCGPTYRTQTEPETCEWFVHDFPEGLPEGRFALWAVWEAPCSAWLDLGFADSCDDPDEVLSLFSSGVDSPFEAG